MLVDDSKTALVADLSQVLVELDQGASVGKLRLHGRDLRPRPPARGPGRPTGRKAFVAADGSVFEETYNLPNAFFATLPATTTTTSARS